MKKKLLDDRQRLQHILDAIRDVEHFTKDIDYDAYQENYLLRLGLTRLVEIIGEAAGQLSRGLRSEFDEVEWSSIKGMRNILIHEYFGIDYRILWNSIKQDVPVLKEKMEEIVREKFPEEKP